MLSYSSQKTNNRYQFVKNKPTYVFSKGEKSKDITLDLSKYCVLLVKPELRISTAEAYRGVVPKPSEVSYTSLPDIKEWRGVLKNDFEDSLFPKYPILEEMKELMYKNGAIYASLSGSGATVYGIFDKEIDIKRLKLPNNTFIWQGRLK